MTAHPPTPPDQEFFQLTKNRPEDLRQIDATLASVFEELRNFTTKVMKWLVQSSEYDKNALPVVMQLRHIVEVLDAMMVMASAGVREPLRMQSRGLYEASLAIAYLLQGNRQTQRQRAVAYLYCEKDVQAHLLEKAASESGSTEQKTQADAIREYLARPCFEEHRKAFAVAKGKKSYAPPWYRLFGGPLSVRKLADRVGVLEAHDATYGIYSRYIHAQDALEHATLHNGAVGFDPIRSRGDIVSTVLKDTLMIRLSLKNAIDVRAPERQPEWHTWNREVFTPLVASSFRIDPATIAV